jgi:hypothetical protein
MPRTHYADPVMTEDESEEEGVMWCEACEDSVCECDTLGSQDTWSSEEEPTTSDEEFIADDDEEIEVEEDEEEEEEWDYDEEDTEDEDM